MYSTREAHKNSLFFVGCDLGFYGPNCVYRCAANCLGNCDLVDGHCNKEIGEYYTHLVIYRSPRVIIGWLPLKNTLTVWLSGLQPILLCYCQLWGGDCGGLFAPDLAVDGNSDPDLNNKNYSAAYQPRLVPHTCSENSTWWMVDLGYMSAVEKVVISYNRAGGE